MQPKAICTIGYEGATVDAFLRALKKARIDLVLDIRAVAASRKKAFSKNQLAAHLANAGIAYRHLRGLGTPKRGRDAAHAGDLDTFESVFLAHMEEPEAQFDLAEAVALAKAHGWHDRPSARSFIRRSGGAVSPVMTICKWCLAAYGLLALLALAAIP
jgi:uncharacterized protein (DUF488 family)